MPSLVEALVEESVRRIHDEITSQLHTALDEMDGDVQQELDSHSAAGFDLEGIKESHGRLKRERLSLVKTQLAAASVPASRTATALAELEHEVGRQLTQHHEAVQNKISLKRAEEVAQKAEAEADEEKKKAADATKAREEAEEKAQQAEAARKEAEKAKEAAAEAARKVEEQLRREQEDMQRQLRVAQEAQALAARQPPST